MRPPKVLRPKPRLWNDRHDAVIVGISIAVAVLLRLVLYFLSSSPGWDTSVYLSMGKFISSGGAVGLWESLRPPLLPLVLAPFFSLEMGGFFIVKIVLFALGILSALLAYDFLKNIEEKIAAIIALVFLACMPLFSVFESRGLSEPFSVFFILLVLVLVVRKHFFLAGITSSLAFLAKFPNGLLVTSVLVWLALLSLMKRKSRRSARNALVYLCGFAIPSSLYLIANIQLYDDPFLPFTLGNHVIQRAGIWLYQEPWYFYLMEMARLNVFLILIPLGLLFWLWKGSGYTRPKNEFLLVLITAAFYLIYFSFLPHKEVRFLVTFLPLFVISASFFFVRFLALYPIPRRLVLTIVIALLVILFVQCGLALHRDIKNYFWKDPYIPLYSVLSPHSVIATTSPIPSAYISGAWLLLYYPLTTPENLIVLDAALENGRVKEAYFNSCDLPCAPQDTVCRSTVIALESRLDAALAITFQKQYAGCMIKIYQGMKS